MVLLGRVSLFGIVYFSIFSVFMGCGKQSENFQQPGKTSVQTEKEDRLLQPFRKLGGDFTRATDLYGPTLVEEGSWIEDTKANPWPAYWLPISDPYLFQEETSPLRKYDLYLEKTTGVAGTSADYEATRVSRAESQSWAGRCDAWALASILESEPILKHPVEVDGVTFSDQDLKALLILTYERVDHLIQFGQRFNGDEESVHADIYPEQFHRVVQMEIFEKKRPFIMDKEIGIEVWNVPVHKAEVVLSKDSTDRNVMHVKTALVGTLPLNSPMKADVQVRRNAIYEYTYDLYGYPQIDGTLKVIYGVWTGNSIRHHPDFLWALPESPQRRSGNEKIDVKKVEEIVKKAKEKSDLRDR